MNDEAIIPLLLSKGATLAEARDYCGSGCVQVRMQNRDTYMSLGGQISLGAVLDMALNDGKLRMNGGERYGLPTGDPRKFTSFDQVMDAFRAQIENIMRHFFIKQYIADTIRPHKLAAPVMLCLHDLCMKQCVDIHQGRIEGGLKLGNCFPVGYGTAVDSLTAIKKLVFDEKKLTMGEFMEALDKNFEGEESIRQMCLNAPKYGNDDPYADLIGREVEGYMVSYAHQFKNLYGGSVDIDYTPVTAHVPLGKALGATPNGRRAKEPLSEGISPSQGCDIHGPTASLMSVARGMNTRYENRAARLLNMKLSPQAVAGQEGTRNLASFIRTWCDQKHWHLQFNIINNETLREARRNPEKYRNLLIRVAGYSAYFVDLSPELQDEIIRRTEHQAF
jgi:pyruvate-formate lyase